jgi:hypothetical protein
VLNCIENVRVPVVAHGHFFIMVHGHLLVIEMWRPEHNNEAMSHGQFHDTAFY